ncbi:hypothetical protein SK128_009959 [Halocaridina rubra]|uniref:Uncharacterized protein n=1 Tax=Halocaridina rubra TaxID=373956 RepID=A0AAN8WX88_HALRR
MKCDCPNGAVHSNGACVSAMKSGVLVEPTPPAHIQAIWQLPQKTKNKPKAVLSESKGYLSPIIFCALTVVSFAISFIAAYYYKKRSLRLEEVRAILNARAAHNASAPNARRASIGSLRDAPPSYNTLSPPSYEQATAQSPDSSSSSRFASPLRSLSYSLSMETAPIVASGLSPDQRRVNFAVTSTSDSCDGANGCPPQNNEHKIHSDSTSLERY